MRNILIILCAFVSHCVYALATVTESISVNNEYISSNSNLPEFDGYYYVKTISIYYDNGGRKESYNAWLYKSRNGDSYGVATDGYLLRRIERFLYQDWMPVWAKQYKYRVANSTGYCNI